MPKIAVFATNVEGAPGDPQSQKKSEKWFHPLLNRYKGIVKKFQQLFILFFFGKSIFSSGVISVS